MSDTFKLLQSDLPTGGRPDVIPINASGLKISACRRRWYLAVVLGLRSKHEDATALRLGKLLHKHIETILADPSPEANELAMLATLMGGRALPTQKLQDIVRGAIAALSAARLPKPMLIDAKPAVEYKFRFPIENTITFEYVGTMDLIRFDSSRGLLGIVDHKTTQKWNYRDVVEGYEGDSQFIFYSAILQKFAYTIFKQDMEMGNLAWYGKFFIQPNIIMLSANPIAIRLGPEWSFPASVIGDLWELLGRFRSEMREFIENEQLPPPDGMACNACPKCPFRPLCFASSGSAYENAIQDFSVVKYDPLTW
jgi:CRISPR/Cas system-associated exonuclease Cas4 (RecB family)